MDIFGTLTFINVFLLVLLTVSVLQNANKRTSNVFLGLFFIAQILTSLNTLLFHYFNDLVNRVPYLYNIAVPFWFVWGPAIFLLIKYEVDGLRTVKNKLMLHFLPAIVIFLFLLFTFYIKPNAIKVELLTSTPLFSYKHYWLFEKLFMVQVLIYNIAAIVKIEKYTRHQTLLSKLKIERLRWNKFIIYGYFMACMVFNAFSILRDFYIDFEQYKLITLIIFTAYFTAILYRSLSSSHFSLAIEKEKTGFLHDTEVEELKSKLVLLMTQQKLFLEPELSLAQLAEKLVIKDKQLSELINNHYKKNFSEYVNDFRLEEAKQLLASPENVKKTILEIIYASGFNSKSVFNLAFKNNTGLTPTQFRKSALGQ